MNLDQIVDRRTVLGMLGVVAVTAACGASRTATSTPTSAPMARRGYTPAPGGSKGTVVLSGSPQPPDKRFTVDQLTRFRDGFAGQWSGAWAEEGGRQGTADVSAVLDVVKRVGTYSLAFSGPLLGGPTPPPMTYVVPVDQFDATSDHAAVMTPLLGNVALKVLGFGKVSLHATQIPNRPDIDSIDLTAAAQTPTSASTSYTINYRSGHVERGALAISKGSNRPPVPSPTQAGTQTDFITGSYAAGLITAAELAAALGEATPAPQPNGGKNGYAAGVDVSDATTTSASGNVIVQYSVFRGINTAAITAYWHVYDVEPIVAGLGDAARAHINGGPTQPYFELYVLKGREVLRLQIEVVAGNRSTAQLDAMYVAVARAIASRMGGG